MFEMRFRVRKALLVFFTASLKILQRIETLERRASASWIYEFTMYAADRLDLTLRHETSNSNSLPTLALYITRIKIKSLERLREAGLGAASVIKFHRSTAGCVRSEMSMLTRSRGRKKIRGRKRELSCWAREWRELTVKVRLALFQSTCRKSKISLYLQI